MPKDTFLNLPIAKQNLIIEKAMDEFAEYGYDNASINRIVAASNIAKGSFYQYFSDKEDLYRHILAIVGERKLVYITPTMKNPMEHDFFTLLEEMYKSGLAFASENPKASIIGYEMYKNQNIPLFKEIFEELKAQGFMFYKTILELAISRGEIDPDIDLPFIYHLLLNLQVTSFDYYFESINKDDKDPSRWSENIMPTVNLMINFIKNGIQLKNKEKDK